MRIKKYKIVCGCGAVIVLTPGEYAKCCCGSYFHLVNKCGQKQMVTAGEGAEERAKKMAAETDPNAYLRHLGTSF